MHVGREVAVVFSLTALAACDSSSASTPGRPMTEAERVMKSRGTPAAAQQIKQAAEVAAGPRTPPAPRFDFGDGPPSVPITLAPERPRGTEFHFEEIHVRVKGSDGYPASGAQVFLLEKGAFSARATADGRGAAVVENELAAGPFELVAVLPRIGVGHLKLSTKPDREVELQLAADPTAALERPTACDPGPFRAAMAVLMPGACPGEQPGLLAALPLQEARFMPGQADYSSPLFQTHVRHDGPWEQSTEWSWVRRGDAMRPNKIRFNETPQAGAPARLRQTLAALQEGFGEPKAELTRVEARPHGDSHCATPVPGSVTATWSFTPPDELKAIAVTARVPDAASVDDVARIARSFNVEFEWPLPPR